MTPQSVIPNPLPISIETEMPTVAQLFGSAYNPDYIGLLPEQIKFEQPVALVPDFTRTKQLIKDFVQRYQLELRMKYPDEAAPNGRIRKSRQYTRRQLNSGTMATLDALLEMYGAYCIAVANGVSTAPAFKIRPSAVMSRRYGAVASANTINDHLERLEGSGLISMSAMQHDQSYRITFNRQVLAARGDKNFTKTVVENILLQCPALAQSQDFKDWQKRLKPSFFAVSSPEGPQFLRAYMLNKKHNRNTPEAELLSAGEPTVPTAPPPFTRNKGATPPQGPAGASGASLGAADRKNEITLQQVISFRAELGWNMATSFSFWKGKKFTDQQSANTQKYLRELILAHIRQYGSDSNYLADVLFPVLRNQQRSILSGKYQWRPPAPDIYFSPDFCTDDGRPAGYQAAVNAWMKITSAKKLRLGTQNKIKQWKLNEKLFIKWFEFFARIPSVKNLKKAEQHILQLSDPEITALFYDSVIASNLVPTEKLMNEIQDKAKAIIDFRIKNLKSKI